MKINKVNIGYNRLKMAMYTCNFSHRRLKFYERSRIYMGYSSQELFNNKIIL